MSDVTAEQIGTTSPQAAVDLPEITPRDDVRADVMAAIEKLKTPEPAAAEGDDTSQQDRPRNERGQFIKTDEQPPAQQQEAAPVETVTDADTPQDKPQEPSPAAAAPKGWSADAKAKWATLDPSIQAEVWKREQDMDNGGRQWSDEKRAYEQTLAPLGDFAGRYGLDHQGALTRLLEWQSALEQDAPQAILQLAQISGVDLRALLTNQQQPSQSQPVVYDPRLDPLAATVSELQTTHINNQIEAFRAAPGHEHFDKVRVQMGQMMERDPSLTLEQAYEHAVWLSPDVRSELIAKQIQPTQQKAKDQQQVQKAKQAASPKGSGPTGNAPVPKPEFSSVREAVVAAAKSHGWNV